MTKIYSISTVLYRFCFVVLVACTGSLFAESNSPNIILFLTDDNDFSYWGFGGGPKISPTIDRLALEGVVATEFYTPSSVCTPSRYILHTSKYAGRCREKSFLKSFPLDSTYSIEWNTFLESGKDVTLANLLQEGGYFTGFVGKWHLGFEDKFAFKDQDDPSDPQIDRKLKERQTQVQAYVRSFGFDRAYSIVPGNNDHDSPASLQYHNLEWYAKGAMDFIQEAKKSKKPYFLIVNITTHHGPCHHESLQQPVQGHTLRICRGPRGHHAPQKYRF